VPVGVVRRKGPNLTAATATLVLTVAISSLSSTAASLPVPPELTLELPLSEIRGVWRATRFAMLLGPTPAIWAYRQIYSLLNRARPVVRRKLLDTAERVQEWASSQGSLGGEAGRRRRLKHSSPSNAAALTLGSGIGPFIPGPCWNVYLSIMRDPRLRRQRLRDSRLMLDGGLRVPNFQSLYREYRKTLEVTLQVARGTCTDSGRRRWTRPTASCQR
jgi:hypothetical protein